MTADDLDEEEVIERFRQITEGSSTYLERTNEYKSEILEREEEKDEGSIQDRIEQGIEQDKKHDNLLKHTVSAFLPNGPIESETGWVFLGAEPLSEENIANADALFGNPERGLALLVECKTSADRPTKALEQVYDAAEGIRSNKDALSEKVGMQIEDLECAICVPSSEDRRIINQIEEHENDGREREKVFVWRLHYYSGEILDLYTDLSTREGGEATHNSELAEILNAGLELTHGRQMMPAFFPSSHPEVIMEEAFSSLLEKRLKDDGQLRYFKGRELLSELSSQKNLPHYDAETIGKRLYKELIERCKRFELIEEVSADDTAFEEDEDETYFKYRVRGKSIETILSNLQERYITKEVERRAGLEAKRRVIDEFDDEQSSLGDFS